MFFQLKKHISTSLVIRNENTEKTSLNLPKRLSAYCILYLLYFLVLTTICISISTLLISISFYYKYRCYANINPQRGTKAPKKKNTTQYSLSPKVLKLVNELK